MKPYFKVWLKRYPIITPFILRFVKPKPRVNVVKEDPEDNKVLECGLEARADYIVTGDIHLLNLRNFNGMRTTQSRPNNSERANILLKSLGGSALRDKLADSKAKGIGRFVEAVRLAATPPLDEPRWRKTAP